ncbi:MAG: methylaspartate mutase epsilon subunit [Pseudonocardiales bacterium]|nr:methylaspartate mutase epsilon subunit [Pseudonocardiales bacterium]
MTVAAATQSFGDVVARAHQAGRLVVQPRMGMSNPRDMRKGLLATRSAAATTVGTITLDSYTRIGASAEAAEAVALGMELNGYPLVAHDLATTAEVLAGVMSPDFPVQIRHGSPCPEPIVAALMAAGLHATEGGPVSYCLPYSRMPLVTATSNWARSCDLLAGLRGTGVEPHLESFGGCMLGQLCPPGLLVALSVLECLFFRQHGVHSVSLSYAQQTNAEQDREAVLALHRLAAELMPDADSHIVLYAYMGVYPRTPAGADGLLIEAARLAVRTGAARLIVKTAAEAHRIPSIAENVAALQAAAAAAAEERLSAAPDKPGDTGIYAEARALVEAVLNLDADLGRALVKAFRRGYLDVPYCLHPDNAGRSRSYLDSAGWLHWSRVGSMPIVETLRPLGSTELTAAGLLAALSFVERRFDEAGRSELPPIPAAVSARHETWRTTPMPQLSTVPSTEPATPTSTREHLASPVTSAALTIQSRMLAATRSFLSQHGFTEVLLPIVGPVTDPGARGAKQVDIDYYGHRYKLMTSAILYKQASLTMFDKIYCIAPNVRLEPLDTTVTSRHLAEFHQIDVEMAGASRDQVMRLVEDLIGYVTTKVLADLAEEFQRLGRDIATLAQLSAGPFGRRTHIEAVAALRELGHPQNPDAEIDWAGEAMLSRLESRPFFVTDYPKGSRGFYDRENPQRPGFLRNFDLIAAEGYGELCSGSEREHDYATIIARMRETGENPAKYAWYLEMVRDGIPASAGFGIGVERLTRYIAGLDAVWQASAYPKIPGVVSP